MSVLKLKQNGRFVPISVGAQGTKGDQGATGPANKLTIGTVTSGIEASATITGEAPNQVLNLVLKQGDKGNPGDDAPTITNIAIRQSDYHMIVTLSDGTSYDAGYCRGASGEGTGDMLASTYDPQGKAQDIFAYVDNAISGVTITTDATPTQGSTNPVQSGGVYTALANKLDKTGDGSNVTAAFTAASSRTNIATGEKLSVLFGKIAKWFSDLGSLAFKSTVAKTDLASGVQTSLDLADTALQSLPSHNHDASAIDSGILPVIRGGTGVNSLASLATALGAARVQKITYTGTGTVGANNPTTLTFDFVPKVVLFFQRTTSVTGNVYYYSAVSPYMWGAPKIFGAIVNAGSGNTDNVVSTTTTGTSIFRTTATVNDKTLKLAFTITGSHTSGSQAQLNASGTTYDAVAFA